jgi:aryl-alcohol dehydrogenase-like predicted oxidoreductase
MEITRVGFGSWAVGGAGWAFSWGPQDDDQSISAIRHAVEGGVNWVDTAAIYGLGHSEEVVAAALEGIPAADRPYIFTKCGLVWDDNDRYKPALRIGAADSIRAGAEASLRRLKVDVLDLLQMHWPPDDGAAVEEYWGAMLELKDQGKVRAVGLSNHYVDALAKAEAVGHVDTLQPPFSAIKRTTATEIAWCADHSTGVIAYSPMQAGLLTGAFTTERVAGLHKEDWRARDPQFQGERLKANLALTEQLRPIAQERGISLAALAVAWALSWPGVTGAIVGARNSQQVDGWLPAAETELTPVELARIAAAIQATGAGDGPVTPPSATPPSATPPSATPPSATPGPGI